MRRAATGEEDCGRADYPELRRDNWGGQAYLEQFVVGEVVAEEMHRACVAVIDGYIARVMTTIIINTHL